MGEGLVLGVAAAACAAALALGMARLHGLGELRGETFLWRTFEMRADLVLVQLGAAGLATCGALIALYRRAARTGSRCYRTARGLLLAGVATLSLAGASGELVMRRVFREGTSFGTHYGPIVARFERDFRYNRFERSRGPETRGPKPEGEIRILVQGDSITWGQAVRDENALFPSRLRGALRSGGADVEMAVIARPGKDLDWHLEQIRKWGPEIEPDLVIYQWFVNDLRLGLHEWKQLGPSAPWRKLFCHRYLVQHSYLWFFLDFRLSLLLPSSGPTFSQYLLETFPPESARWAEVAANYSAWVREARSLTPRVLLALYPTIQAPNRMPTQALRRRFAALSRELGVPVLDLADALRGPSDDYSWVPATPFDGHPGEQAHARIAEALERELRRLWPDVFGPVPIEEASQP